MTWFYKFTDCRISYFNHTLSEDNLLNVFWNFSGSTCASSQSVSIRLKDISCEDNCNKTGCQNTLYDACNVVQTIRNSTFNTTLRPCANYSYSLVYASQWNTSTSFEANRKIGSIENLTAHDYVAETFKNSNILNLNITWDYPYPECNENFNVKIAYEDSDNPFTQTLNTSQYIYKNVTACYHYNITVTHTQTDISISLNTEVDTRRVNASSIRNFDPTVNNETNLLELKWQHPIYGARCFDTYKISLDNEYENIPPAYRKSTENLYYTPLNYLCVDYNVKIRTFTNDSGTQPTTVLPTTTISLISPSPEKEIMTIIEQEESRNFTSNSVILKTAEIPQPTLITRTDTSFALSVKVDVSKNKCKIKEFHFSCINSIDDDTRNETLESSLSEVNVTVGDLEPYSNYSCMVYVLNLAGWSENATMGDFTTKQGSRSKNYFSKILNLFNEIL